MVSLPSISQRGSLSLSESTRSIVSSESGISTFFCNDCTHDLALPVRHINRSVLRKYEEKYAQIRNMQRLLNQEETTLEEDKDNMSGSYSVTKTSTFQISGISKETLQVYAFGFPLITQSKLVSPQSGEFNWERLKNKLLKRQSRSKILNKTSQFAQKLPILKHLRSKVRQLPSLESEKRKEGRRFKKGVFTECSDNQKMLNANPKVVLFDDNHQVGGYYEKRCKITNVSRGKCRFEILPLDKTSQFRVVYNKAANPLASGLSFWVTIQFNCQSLADIEENLIIRATDGEDLVVLIKVENDPPCLVEVNDEDSNLDVVVDSLIDCGSHFVGEESEITLTLKNIGSASRFCFITESDWVSLEFSMDTSNTLVADPFSIRPMYFGLNEDQQIVINVTVTPPSKGMHTSRVLLLCENGTVNPVDLVCDGVLFEPILLEHLDMLKTFDVDKPDVMTAECYLDFGQMLTYDIRYTCFFITNVSDVNISYHWEMRRVEVPGTDPLAQIAVSIYPMRGRFAPRQADIFCLKINTDCVPPGVYRTMLVLVIDDLPNKCVPLNYCNRLIPPDEESDNDLRSMEAKYIEVWLECVTPTITLNPYVIDFSDFPIVIGSPVEKREIIIKNDSPGDLSLSWECFEESSSVRVSIDPPSVKCSMYSTFTCTLTAEAVQEGPFEISFWCISGKKDAKVELLVKGNCCKPRLTTLTDYIDFGIAKVGTLLDTAIVAKNCSPSDSFQWALDELHFQTSEEGLVSIIDAPTTLSTNAGEICHRNSEILVSYQLKCVEDELWCSVLDWDGDFIPVIANIQVPDVSLETYTLSADPIYLNVPCEFRLTATNHSLINAAVFWGTTTDKTLNAVVTVEVEPRCFELEPQAKLTVVIKITPHKIGPLENLYIPCFVVGVNVPSLLKVEGNVEGLSVRIEWDSKDQHCCVFWPHPKLGDEDDPSDKFICKCPPNSLKESETSLLKSLDSVEFDILPLTSDSHFTICTALSNTVSNNGQHESHKEESIDEEDNISEASSIPYENWPIVGGRYTRNLMDEEWEEHFNNLFILEELRGETNNVTSEDPTLELNSLCFNDIPVGKSVTQTIYIRNDTAIPTTYETYVVYNFERGHKSDKPRDAENVLKKMKNRYDEYVERASQHRGLTVFVTPDAGELASHDYVTLSVTVVALSWGRYSDTIVLQVGDLDHLCVKLSVTVTQPPVIAPRAVGFGTLPQGSPPVSRYFKVENVSTVPVYVCWDIFSSKDDDEELPFSAMLFDNDPFDLKLTDYYGSNYSEVFRIKDKYTLLEPQSSKMVEVNFCPLPVKLDVEFHELDNIQKATIIGHIYTTEDGKIVTLSENCKRREGATLPPLRVELEVRVEVPCLTLLNVFNYQLIFKCTANDIMKTKEKFWSEKSVVGVQNNSRTILEAKVYTVGFFHVTKIEYPCAEDSHKNSKHRIILRPGETCQVTIVCKITESEFLECFDPDTESLDEGEIGLWSVEKGLLCFEQKDVKQDVQLALYLYPPLLYISDSDLNFGEVFIEDTKTLILKITAPMTEEYFEAYIKSGKSTPFNINQTAVTLKPMETCLLKVFFSPKSCTIYQDILVVRACMDRNNREIPLTGIGTFDYRAHTY